MIPKALLGDSHGDSRIAAGLIQVGGRFAPCHQRSDCERTIGDDVDAAFVIEAQHSERRNRDAAQRKTGIAGERRFKNADRVAGQAVIVGDRAVERRGRFGRAGERESLLVFGLSRLS
jgi:hypothetical protein